MGKIVGLFVSPAAGQPMQARAIVRALAGQGLEGDRYCSGLGTYSNVRRHVLRHVSLIACEAIAVANEQLHRSGLMPFDASETRRNILVEGLDVYALLGRSFKIGTVHMRGSEPTMPCHVPSRAAGKTGFKDAYESRGGILAEILSDGDIALGDVLTADALHG